MKLNELFVNQESVVSKDIVIKEEKCKLVYLKDILNKYPKEVFSIIKENSPVACIKLKELEYTLFCEEIYLEKDDVCYRFEVYVDFKDGENYCRTEYIPQTLCEPIENEEELINIIKDLMDYTYFK